MPKPIAKKAAPRKPARKRKPPAAKRSNATELEVTLKALQSVGRFESVDAAFLQALRSMAAALDARPAHAQLWKSYIEALGKLTSDEDDDGLGDELLSEMQAASRHPPAP